MSYGEVILQFSPANSPIETIACTSDSQKLIVGQAATDEGTPTLSIVDINTGNIDKIIEKSDDFNNAVWHLAIDKSNNYIFYLRQTGSNFQIIKYNLKTEAKNMIAETTTANQYQGLVIGPENQLTIGVENQISFYDLETNKLIKTIRMEDSRAVIEPDVYTSLAFSPDENLMAVGGLGYGEVVLYDMQKAEIIHRLEANFNFPKRMVFDPTGKYLFILGQGMYIWNLQTGDWHKEERFGENWKSVICIDFDKNNPRKLAMGTTRSVLFVMDYEAVEKLFSDELHKARIYDVLFTPDGKKLITSGEDWQIVVRSVESKGMACE